MVVGSLSSTFYGTSRATQDADFVIELGDRSVHEIARLLGPDFVLDPQLRFEGITATARNVIDIRDTQYKIELFRLGKAPFDQERFRRRVRITLEGRETWLPTVEDVVVMKLLWSRDGDRLKDKDDVRNILGVQGDAIDWDYVHRWCDEHGTRDLLDEIRASIPPI